MMDIPSGIHHHRLQANNPREVAFWETWQREHALTDFVDLLLRMPCERADPQCVNAHCILPLGGFFRYPIGSPSERDRILCSTLMQWLGTNCGLGMMQMALEKCGYEIRKKKAMEIKE